MRWRTGPIGDIGITGRVDHHFGKDGFAPRFGFSDDALDLIALEIARNSYASGRKGSLVVLTPVHQAAVSELQ